MPPPGLIISPRIGQRLNAKRVGMKKQRAAVYESTEQREARRSSPLLRRDFPPKLDWRSFTILKEYSRD